MAALYMVLLLLVVNCTSFAGITKNRPVTHELASEDIVESLLQSLEYVPLFYEGQDLSAAPMADFGRRTGDATQNHMKDDTMALHHAWSIYQQVPWWDDRSVAGLEHATAAAHNVAGFLLSVQAQGSKYVGDWYGPARSFAHPPSIRHLSSNRVA